MEKSSPRPRTPLRVNALAMALIAAVLVVFVIAVIDNPSTELIVALVAPVIVGCVAVMDKLCSPEPKEPKEPKEQPPPDDDYTKAVVQLFEKSLFALSAAPPPSAPTDAHRQGDRGDRGDRGDPEGRE